MKIDKYIETLIFSNQITDDNTRNHIIEKFNSGTIDTEKLRGQLEGKYSFRLNIEQRAIGIILSYQGKNSLVVVEFLSNHKYKDCSKDSLDTLNVDKKVSEEGWEVFTRNTAQETEAGVDSIVNREVSGVAKCLVKVDIICALDTQQLAILEQTNERPIVTITGVAGSGKTLVAELLIEQERARKEESKILYVTSSANLVNSVKEHCQQAGLVVDIKTFQECYAPIIINKLFRDDDGKHYCKFTKTKAFSESLLDQALSIINGNKSVAAENPELFNYITSHLVSENYFINYYKINENDKIKVRHLYQDICKKDNHQNFQNLGKKRLHNNPENIEKAYSDYKKNLTMHKFIDLALIDYPENNDCHYDTILIDESQDFVGNQLRHLHSLLKENGRLYFFIDTNQSIEDDLNLVYEDIKTLAATQEKAIISYELKRGYRNARNVIELANRVLRCGRVLVGGVLSSGLRVIEAIEEANLGYLEWIDVKKDKKTDSRCESLLRQNPSKLQMVVVVPSNSPADEALAKKLFPQRMLFTPGEIKGLEFDKIILINFFTKEKFKLESQQLEKLENIDWNQDDKCNNPKDIENAHYNRSSTEAFVGITRARQAVYIIQSTEDKISTLFKNKIFGDIFNQNQKEYIMSSGDSLEEIVKYLEGNAIKLELDNLLLLCKEALSKVDEAVDSSRIDSLKKIKEILEFKKLKSLTDEEPIGDIITLINQINEGLDSSTHSQLEAQNSREPALSIGASSPERQASNCSQNEFKLLNALKNVDFDKIERGQLEQIINGKTGLYNLLESIPSEEFMNLSNAKFSNFLKKITPKALNHCNNKGESALFLLVSSEKYNDILNRMLKGLANKITGDDLNKIGPSGLPLIFYLAVYQEKFFKEYCIKNIKDGIIKNICKTIPLNGAKYVIESKQTLFHIAIMQGNFEIFNDPIIKEIDINAVDREGDTVLQWIVNDKLIPSLSDDKRVEIFKYLVDCGVKVDISNEFGEVPFHGAAAKGYLEIVKFLVEECRVNIDPSSYEGYTPLHCASRHGHLPIVQYLVDKEANIHAHATINKFTPLHFAIGSGHLKVVQFFIEKQNENVEKTTPTGFTPLYLAVYQRHISIVEYLIKKGADMNACNRQIPCTPLELAKYFKDDIGKKIFDYLTLKNPKQPQLRQSMSGLPSIGDSTPQLTSELQRFDITASRLTAPSRPSGE